MAKKTRKAAANRHVKHEDAYYGWHELLHTSAIISSMIVREIIEHQCINDRPHWKELAQRAYKAMFDFYQAVGDEHLATPDEQADFRPTQGPVRRPVP